MNSLFDQIRAANEPLEPGRPATSFIAFVAHSDLRLFPIEGEVLQDVYDIAINSMDFGSGFLCAEEIQNLRILGPPTTSSSTTRMATRLAGLPSWNGCGPTIASACSR